MGLFSNLTELFKKITDSVEEAELENLKVSDADTLDASGPEGQNPLIQDSFQTSYPLHDDPITEIHETASSLRELGAQGYIDTIADQDAEHVVPHEMLHMAQHSTEADETHTLSLADAVAVLEQARTALNESGIDSDLRDLINHPDADVMIENLQAAGIDPLTVSGPEIDGQSPEEQIMSVLEAAQDATYEHGLDMPQAEQDMPEAMQSTSFDYEYTNASDDYGIV